MTSFFFWVARMAFQARYFTKSRPFKDVLIHGLIRDAQGRKMSKSLGNGVDPAEVMAKSGADVLRLWVASVDYSQDVSISDEILQRTSEAYRRIRNTFRFLLGSLDDFDDQKDAVSDWNALEPLDQWAMVRTKHLLDDVSAAYDAYKFHYVYRAVYDYIVNDLSAVYMDATKDRLYSEAPDSPRRRAVQTVLMNILEVLVRVLAPCSRSPPTRCGSTTPQAMRERAGRRERAAGRLAQGVRLRARHPPRTGSACPRTSA